MRNLFFAFFMLSTINMWAQDICLSTIDPVDPPTGVPTDAAPATNGDLYSVCGDGSQDVLYVQAGVPTGEFPDEFFGFPTITDFGADECGYVIEAGGQFLFSVDGSFDVVALGLNPGDEIKITGFCFSTAKLQALLDLLSNPTVCGLVEGVLLQTIADLLATLPIPIPIPDPLPVDLCGLISGVSLPVSADLFGLLTGIGLPLGDTQQFIDAMQAIDQIFEAIPAIPGIPVIGDLEIPNPCFHVNNWAGDETGNWGGPAYIVTVVNCSVPTMGFWALIILGLSICTIGVLNIRTALVSQI